MPLAKPLMEAAGNAALPTYIEDVFSTYLYSGTGSTLNINNGVDLATKGGMVWIKNRQIASDSGIFDTARGRAYSLSSSSTAAQTTSDSTQDLKSFNTNGFSLDPSAYVEVNSGGYNYASWTFRKQPKFFDVVTYTGNGTSQNIAHSLGSTPACIIVKRTDALGNWLIYHRSLGATQYLLLHSTAAAASSTAPWNDTAPTSTVFTVGNSSFTNTSGGTYVAYIFAHDAGGFGLTGTDNVISCGSYTGSGAGTASVTLGYEPQWLLIKNASSALNWNILDTTRGLSYSQTEILRANTTDALASTGAKLNITPTGFKIAPAAVNDSSYDSAGNTYIYIAIRRGPMKVPTDGTTVYNAVTRTGTSATATVTAGFPHDLLMVGVRNQAYGTKTWDRLRGITNPLLYNNGTSAEYSGSSNSITAGTQTGITVGADSDWTINNSGNTYVNWFFKRAPGFFDEVCYTGNGTTQNLTHNLGAVPALMLVKRRDSTGAWLAWSTTLSSYSSVSPTNYGLLNSTAAFYGAGYGNETVWGNNTNTVDPTSSVFTVGSYADVNTSGGTYVAYLFATCPGVSKVGSYTGNGSSQTINCGFTSGARFILIKRTNSTGDWYVWDTARGIVAGNDGHLSLNTTAAEVTTDDTIDTDSSGFIVNQLAATNVNVNAATYIYLAIA